MNFAERHARVRLSLEKKLENPLEYWHFAVPRLKEAFSLFTADSPIDELALRACNKGTKTETDAAWVIACAQKRRELDGVPIPRWRGPVECVQLVLDYPQQLLSVQPAYLRLLGRWPHHPRYKGETLTSLKIKPQGGSDDETTWSTVYFQSQLNHRSGVGVRGDVVAFDEPPKMDILRELRKAAHAGRKLCTVIGFTPTIRRQYAEFRKDYGDEPRSMPRSSLKRLDRHRAQVRWSLHEVADWVLSQDEKNSLIEKYQTDPLIEARLHGDYCVTEGKSPWGAAGTKALEQMLMECEIPNIIHWPIKIEGSDVLSGDSLKLERHIPVEVYAEIEAGKDYLITIDPSSGVDDDQHDPYELELTEQGSGDLVMRAGGYLPGYTVGVLAAGIARQANGCMIDVEVNDKWGVNVIEGVRAGRYNNFATERRELKNGTFANEIGFHNNQRSRPIIIGSVQNWLNARAAGVRYGECKSRKVIETLQDCVLDERGKIVGGPGVHDECLIVRGQALRRCVRRFGQEVPDFDGVTKGHDEMLIEKLIKGEIDEGGQPGGIRWPKRF